MQNARHGALKDDLLQPAAVGEGTPLQKLHALRDGYGLQRCAAAEGELPDGAHALRDLNMPETRAFPENRGRELGEIR